MRLNKKNTILKIFFGLMPILFSIQEAIGQSNPDFTFVYNGPDTIFVGNDCNAILNWGHPTNPQIIALNPANPATSFGLISISDGYDISSVVPAGTTVRVTYRLVDSRNTTTNYAFNIRFVDTIKPKFDQVLMPPAISIYCGDIIEIPNGALTDNCTNENEIVVSFRDSAPFNFCAGGMVTRNWTATDRFGNRTIYSQRITTLPNNGPLSVLSPPQDLLIDCSSQDANAVFQSWLLTRGNMLTNGCGSISYTTIPSSPALGQACNTPQNVTFIAKDICNKTIAASASYRIVDPNPPTFVLRPQNKVITCDNQPLIPQLNTWLQNKGGSFYQDGCTPVDQIVIGYKVDGISYSITQIDSIFSARATLGCQSDLTISGTRYNKVLGHTPVLFTFTDQCGNRDSSLAHFIALDRSAPQLVSPAVNRTILCDSGTNLRASFDQWFLSGGGATGKDDCGFVRWRGQPNLDQAYNQLLASRDTSCGNTGSIKVDFYLGDYCGNEQTTATSATFRILHQAAPLVNNQPIALQKQCTANINDTIKAWVDSIAFATFDGGCGGKVKLQKFTFVSSAGFNLTGTPGVGPYPLFGSNNCQFMAQVRFIVADECGNTNSVMSSIAIQDTLKPEILFFPSDITLDCSSNITITNGPTARDNCFSVVDIGYTDTNNQSTNPRDCGYYQFTTHRNWKITDGCGNSIFRMQKITYIDTTKPTFTTPNDLTIDCGSSDQIAVTGTPTNIFDNCDVSVSVAFSDVSSFPVCVGRGVIIRKWILTDVCGNADSSIQKIVVDDRVPPAIVSGAQSTIIYCKQGTEKSQIWNQWLLNRGGANATDSCSSVQTFAAVPGSYTISDPTTWPGTSPGALNSLACPSPIPQVSDREEVDFVLYDGCKNAIVLKGIFEVKDTSAPLITQCADTLFFQNILGACNGIAYLVPPVFEDGCSIQKLTSSVNESVRISSDSPGSNTITVRPFDLNIQIQTEPLSPFIDNVLLNLQFDGLDGEGPQEFFEIFGENGRYLGRTNLSSSECGTSNSSVLTITPAELNAWASDGIVKIHLSPFGSGEPSINDICRETSLSATLTFVKTSNSNLSLQYSLNGGPLLNISGSSPKDTLLDIGIHTLSYVATDCFGNSAQCTRIIKVIDSERPTISCNTSQINASLNGTNCTSAIDIPIPTNFRDNCPLPTPQKWYYSISGATNISFAEAISTVGVHTAILNAGVSKFTWYGFDAANNIDSCSIIVYIRDLTAPIAVCKPTILYVNPSGIIGTALQAIAIDGGSTDNCRIGAMSASPSFFDCNQVGSSSNVTLTVFDEAGNSNSCITQIRVESYNLSPQYSVGICSRDTLKLYANPPHLPNSLYTYEWSGPANFYSTEENPIRLNADMNMNGLYYVTVTGFGGCKATGIVSVNISPQISTPSIFISKDKVCDGSQILLETTSFEGNFIYRWYRGIAPNGTFIDSTSVPQYNLILPIGVYNFYVQVSRSNCASNPSNPGTVEVIRKPVASVRESLITVCENSNLTFGTDYVGNGITYLWTGPNNFRDTNQNIIPINPVSQIHEGRYLLQAFKYGCPADPVAVNIDVTPLPGRPLLMVSNTKCPGEDLIFTITNNPNATTYQWIHPNQTVITTTANNLTLPNASSSNNGIWRATLFENGCESLPSDSILISIEPLYNITASNNGPKCAGDTITLGAPQIDGATYQWLFGNLSISDLSRFSIPANSGVYTLNVTTQGGCKYSTQTNVVAIDPPLITAISNTGNQCITLQDSVKLSATIFPPDNGTYTYIWTGPNFTSSFPTPTLFNISPANSGIYNLVVSNIQGCRSVLQGTLVDLKAKPPIPQLSGKHEVCEGDTLSILVTPPDPLFIYKWNTPKGTVISTISELRIAPTTFLDNGVYQVVMEKNGCLSDTSASFLINIKNTPSKPTIFGKNTVCEGDSILMYSLIVPGATYHWTGPGFISNLSNPVIFPSREINEGNYNLRIEVNGCFSPLANVHPIIVNTKPSIPLIRETFDSLCVDATGLLGRLCVDDRGVIPGSEFVWYAAGTNLPFTNSTNALCTTVSNFSNFITGNNEIYVRAHLNGCYSDPTLPVMVRIDRPPSISAIAGSDVYLCNDNQITLSAHNPAPAIGYWQVLTNGNQISNHFSLSPTVSSLVPGQNVFVLTLDYLTCKAFGTDTVIAYRDITPIANSDVLLLDYSSSGSLNILSNDQLNFYKQVNFITNPTNGSYNRDTLGNITYTPYPNFIGKDFAIYKLCSSICPTLCDTAIVHFIIGNDKACNIPNVFTPNGDGINDYFVIPCVFNPEYNKNGLMIFNEWGDEVFSEKPYTNSWQGLRKGTMLPDGTYFYVFDPGNSRPRQTGFIMIKR